MDGLMPSFAKYPKRETSIHHKVVDLYKKMCATELTDLKKEIIRLELKYYKLFRKAMFPFMAETFLKGKTLVEVVESFFERKDLRIYGEERTKLLYSFNSVLTLLSICKKDKDWDSLDFKKAKERAAKVFKEKVTEEWLSSPVKHIKNFNIKKATNWELLLRTFYPKAKPHGKFPMEPYHFFKLKFDSLYVRQQCSEMKLEERTFKKFMVSKFGRGSEFKLKMTEMLPLLEPINTLNSIALDQRDQWAIDRMKQL
jgi:hypothetical protein